MEKVLTYEEFTGSVEKTPEKIAEYLAYLKVNGREIWKNKIK